jgi:hypothetical protein
MKHGTSNDRVLLTRSYLQLVSDDLGLKLDKVEPSMLGQVKKVVVSKDDTVLLDGAGSSDAIQDRIVQVCNANCMQAVLAHDSSQFDVHLEEGQVFCWHLF